MEKSWHTGAHAMGSAIESVYGAVLLTALAVWIGGAAGAGMWPWQVPFIDIVVGAFLLFISSFVSISGFLALITTFCLFYRICNEEEAGKRVLMALGLGAAQALNVWCLVHGVGRWT